jgi:hypothetical protein
MLENPNACMGLWRTFLGKHNYQSGAAEPGVAASEE